MRNHNQKSNPSHKENRMNPKKIFSYILAIAIAVTQTACGGGGGGGNNGGTKDDTKPTVSITSPVNGATVGGAAVHISCNASDSGSGVSHVDIKLDNTVICSTTSTNGGPYACDWNSTGVTNDTSYTLSCVAYDVAGNANDPNDPASKARVTVHNTVLNGTWRSVTSPTTKNLNGLWAAAADNIYAVGDTGTIIHWNGSTWSTVTSITSANLNAIWGSNPNNIWVAGDNGTVLHWDGLTWSMVASSTVRNLTSVWGTDANFVLMTGGGGAGAGSLIWWVGSYWSVVPYVYDSFLSMTGFSQTDAWAVGYNGIIRHWNGSAWTSSVSNTGLSLYAVWGSASNDVWAAGEFGTILHWNGSTWSPVASATNSVGIIGIGGTDASDVWFLWSNGSMEHWDGTSLSVVRSASTDYMRAIKAVSTSDVWSVGNGGKILRFSP